MRLPLSASVVWRVLVVGALVVGLAGLAGCSTTEGMEEESVAPAEQPEGSGWNLDWRDSPEATRAASSAEDAWRRDFFQGAVAVATQPADGAAFRVLGIDGETQTPICEYIKLTESHVDPYDGKRVDYSHAACDPGAAGIEIVNSFR